MKRFRNVAVRMRPAAAPRLDDLDQPVDPDWPDSDVAPEASAVLRSDAAPSTRPLEESAPRRSIWDLDPPQADGDHMDPEPERAAEPDLGRDPDPDPEPFLLQESFTVPGPAPAQTGSPVQGSAARARTRVLGFNSQDLVPDAFATAEQDGTATPQFRAGWMVVVEGPGRGTDFGVSSNVSSIGRGADQDITLDFGDETISRDRHAAVVYDAEQNRFFIGHGNKANVVRRNGQPVLSTEEMFDGDLIRIGKTTLRFVALCGEDFTWDLPEVSPDD